MRTYCAAWASRGKWRERTDRRLSDLPLAVMTLDLYPDIEPYGHGMLEVGDGNLLYWEMCGNPQANQP